MANRARQRSQRRAQIIIGVCAILVVLSMVVSLVWSFSTPTPSTTTSQPRPTLIVITPAP